MKSAARILIIDDDADLRESLALYLKIHFETVKTLGDPQGIHSLLNEAEFDLLLLDMNFQKGRNDGQEGLYWLKHIKDLRSDLMVLLITAYGDIDLAIEALKSGASDFILKPWENQKLLASLLRAYELKSTRKKLNQFQIQQSKKGQVLIDTLERTSKDPSSLSLLQQARTVAQTEANVLIGGPNGTGKSLLAQYIHLQSPRRDAPFVSVDLGSIPDTLFESELFGSVKGAYTDAREDRQGLISQAEGGTLFLDEIGNCSMANQQKLLRLLQERSYQALGSADIRYCDIRIICATNLDLEKAIEVGDFRQDLYFRINTIHLAWSSLKDRPQDLKALMDHYLLIYNQKYQKQFHLNEDQKKEIGTYHWPGNIRELAHSLERAVILNLVHEPLGLSGKQPEAELAKDFATPIHYNLEDLEAYHIERVVNYYHGNISKAAQHLGVNRNTLYRKLEKYQISHVQ